MRMSTLLEEVRKFSVDEGFSPKEIKMAIGIASDPRYARGNMTGAVTAIERMKKGLSKHPQVMAVLKRQNEDIDEAVSPAQQAAIAISKKERGEKPKEEGNAFGMALKSARDKGDKTFVVSGKTYNVEDYDVQEDGHTDVASAQNNVKVAMSALTKMSGELAKLNPEDALPSWWTNKVAVAVDKLDGMADYLDTQVEALDTEDEPKVKEIIKKLKGASKAHAGQADDLEKAVKEEVELDEAPKMRYALVGKDMKIYSMGSDERDLRLDRRSLEKRFPDAAPLKMARLKTAQAIGDKVDKSQLKEEVELDEAKYDLYHKDFSSAMQHAYAMAKKLHGVTIDPKEIDDKVATGPKKPSKGKTNSYRLKGKGGAIQVQVANLDDKKFELNMYKEEVELPLYVELDEMKMNDPKLLKVFDKLKKGSTVKLKTSSTINKGKDFVEYIVKSKNTVNKGRVEKITLATVGNEGAVKKFLYKRDGTVGFAIGDMGASIDDIKEDTNMDAYVSRISVDEGAAADARRDMRRDPDMRSKRDSEDVSATTADVEKAANHIIMQLRKSVSMKGQKDVEFASGKQKVPPQVAQKILDMYNKQRTSADKSKFQMKIAKSYKDLLTTVKGR